MLNASWAFILLMLTGILSVMHSLRLHLQMRKLGWEEVEGFAQGHSPVKWRHLGLSQVQKKQITFRKVERGGTGFPVEARASLWALK